jgi:MFS family permease
MTLLAPDILQEARQLSVGVCVTAIVLGLLLWLFGWRGHRFWIVLATTVSAGIVGLAAGPSYGAHPLAAGLLLALAAGVLALALARVVAFVAGGIACWVTIQTVAPTWHDPLICFLAGGLVGLLMFRIWTMALTSFAGAMLLVYSCLSLADRLGKLDAVGFAEQQVVLLNWLCGGMTTVGLLVQFLLERRRAKAAGSGKGKGQKPRAAQPRRREDGPANEERRPWYLQPFRQAG